MPRRVQRGAQGTSARTNDVEAGRARRILGWPGSLAGSRRREAEQGLAVAAAEQEDKALQVAAQLRDAVGGVADELFQRWAEAGGVAAQPLAADGLRTRLAEVGTYEKPRRALSKRNHCTSLSDTLGDPTFQRKVLLNLIRPILT